MSARGCPTTEHVVPCMGMAEDGLERTDVENAILNGAIDKKLTRDIRGTRCRIAGPATDGRSVRVVCRFKEAGGLIIITVQTVRGKI